MTHHLLPPATATASVSPHCARAEAAKEHCTGSQVSSVTCQLWASSGEVMAFLGALVSSSVI